MATDRHASALILLRHNTDRAETGRSGRPTSVRRHIPTLPAGSVRDGITAPNFSIARHVLSQYSNFNHVNRFRALVCATGKRRHKYGEEMSLQVHMDQKPDLLPGRSISNRQLVITSLVPKIRASNLRLFVTKHLSDIPHLKPVAALLDTWP